MTWYELDKRRLVLEYIRVTSRYDSFRLHKRRDQLSWRGTLSVVVAGVTADTLEMRITYPDSFPVLPPVVEVLSPVLDPAEVGHSWHRWVEGNVCYIRPRDWGIGTTTDEVIDKVGDWYHNYIAFKRGLIPQMPDVGRAPI